MICKICNQSFDNYVVKYPVFNYRSLDWVDAEVCSFDCYEFSIFDNHLK